MEVIKIKQALSKEINIKFGNDIKKIYLEKVRQSLDLPCFYFSLISDKKQTIAYIDYLREIELDIQYIPNNVISDLNKNIENTIYKLNSIEFIIIESQKIMIQLQDIEIIDNVLHYIIKLSIPLTENNIIKPTNNTYLLILNKLKEITNKNVYYINGNLLNLKEGFFVIEPNTIETQPIGLNGLFRDITREINIRYVSTDLKIDIPSYLEDTIDKLILELKKIKNSVYKLSYTLDIDYEKEEYRELNVVSHELTLFLTERNK